METFIITVAIIIGAFGFFNLGRLYEGIIFSKKNKFDK